MPPARRTQLRLGVNRLQAHQPHQPLHPLAADRLPWPDQPLGQPPAAQEGVGGVRRVEPPHQPQALRRLGRRLVVQAGAAQAEQLALPPDTQLRVAGLDQGPQPLRRSVRLFLSHSSSILRRPICSNSSAFWASASAMTAWLPFWKTWSAPARSCFFRPWIRAGWTPYWLASSLTVLSPRRAAKATWALNAAVCCFRLPFIVYPLPGPPE